MNRHFILASVSFHFDTNSVQGVHHEVDSASLTWSSWVSALTSGGLGIYNGSGWRALAQPTVTVGDNTNVLLLAREMDWGPIGQEHGSKCLSDYISHHYGENDFDEALVNGAWIEDIRKPIYIWGFMEILNLYQAKFAVRLYPTRRDAWIWLWSHPGHTLPNLV